MQTTSAAMIDDLLKVISEYQSKFVGIYETLQDLKDAVGTPSPAMQAIVIEPSEFYYHVTGGKWTQFAPVGKIHPGYIGSYDNLPDLKSASPTPKDGDLAILGKNSFYVADGGAWLPVIIGAGKADNSKTIQNTADIAKNTADIGKIENRATLARTQSQKNQNNIAKMKTILTLTRATMSKLDPRPIFEFYASGMPKLPDAPQSAYFIDIYAITKTETLTLPYFPSSPVRDGAIFFLNNRDTDNQIRIASPDGLISGAGTVGVPPGNIIALAKTPSGWQNLFSGYMADSVGRLMSDVNLRLADRLHTNDEILAMIDGWLANPNTQAKIDKMLTTLGYQKTGSQPAVLPSDVRVHIGAADDYPDDFTGETGEFEPHQDMTISGLDADPKKVWVAVPNSLSTKVTGISANDGLPARWSSTRKTINGAAWKIFLSPTEIADSTLKIDIMWRI